MITFITNWQPETRKEMDMIDAKHNELYDTPFSHANIKTGRVVEREVARDIYNKKVTFISSSITLHFANAGITDNADLIRCNMFGQALADMAMDNNLTMDNAYNDLSYSSLPCHIDTPSMQEIIDKVNKLKEMEI